MMPIGTAVVSVEPGQRFVTANECDLRVATFMRPGSATSTVVPKEAAASMSFREWKPA